MHTDLLLPPGSVLVHIGPYKTGSTSVQFALFARQDELREQGVLFPGRTHRQRRPGWGVMGWKPRGRMGGTLDEWNALVASLRDVGEQRVCLTTEDFGWASRDQAGRIVTDLGADRVHVLAVVRRLDRLLPSEWQERVKTFQQTKPYADWLHCVLAEDRDDPAAQEFWASHDVGRQLRNWTSAVPAGQMTVVVTDDTDRRVLARTFEQMLGLPEGYLHSTVDANTSLPAERVEVLRRLNEAASRHEWNDRLRALAIEDGAKAAFMTAPPSPFDHRLPGLPAWAIERVRQLSEQQIAAIGESGVRVVGDPACLRTPLDPAGPPEPEPPLALSVDAASQALEGVIEGGVRLAAETDRKQRRTLNGARQKLRATRRELADTRAQLTRAHERLAAAERAQRRADAELAELRQQVERLQRTPAVRASRLLTAPVRTLRGRADRVDPDQPADDGEH